MQLSRRSLGKSCGALLAASALPWEFRGVLATFQSTTLPQRESSSSLPRFVVEDFSKVFDAAYLSNGLIGIRPGPNPLAKAQTCVSGFDFVHPAHKVECLSPAPYPLETDIRAGGMSLLKHTDLVKIRRQTLDTGCGELITEMEFTPGNGARLVIEVLQFASRSVPSLLCQQIGVTASADTEIEFIPQVEDRALPGKTYLSKIPERAQIDLILGMESEGNLSKLGLALWIATPGSPVQKQEISRNESGLARTYFLKARSGQPVLFQTTAAMLSSLYHPEPALEAIRLASWGSLLGFETLRQQNRAAWAELWKSRVQVTGDEDSQRVLDA